MSLFDFAIRAMQKIRYPHLARAVDDTLEFGLRDFLKAPPEGLRAFRNWLPTEDVHTWLKEELPKAGGFIRRTIDEFHSPDMVLNRHEAGRRIYEVAQQTDLAIMNERNKLLTPFEKLARKVDAEGSTRVFQALEKPDLVETLNTPEKLLHDHLKGQYDFLWKQYIFQTVGKDQNKFNKVMRWSIKGLDEDQLAKLPEEMQEGYRLARATIRNYAPHMWRRDTLIEMLTSSRQRNALKYTQTADPVKKAAYREAIQSYDDSLRRLAGGDPLAYEYLPKEILFRHGLLRKGALGYQEDAIRSYRSYIYSLTKKVIDEPAYKEMAALYNELPFEMRPYAKWFIRQYAGLTTKDALSDIAGAVASFEYVRALGWNLRSAITNLTQQLNTWADAGIGWSTKGYVRSLTDEGTALWRRSGLGVQVPKVLTDEIHPETGALERYKRIAGYFFNLAEGSNRKHAFLTYLSKAESKFGKDSPEAWKAAIDGVYRTQFAYGRVGMPKILRTPAGRVVGQFGSFSIKQAEFLWRLAKESPLKFVQWAAMAEGGNYAVGEILGFDLSNALGFGISFGEALEAFRSMSRGEFDEMFAHGQLAFSQGSGILPSGPGPAATGLMSVLSALRKGERPAEAIAKELTPVAWDRVESILTSIKNRELAREPGKVPVGKVRGLPGAKELTDIQFEQEIGRTITEIGPKAIERTRKTAEWFKQSRMDVLESKRKRLIAETIAAGDREKAEKLIGKYGVVPTRDAIYEAVLRRNLPREARPRYQKAAIRQRLRELRREAEE